MIRKKNLYVKPRKMYQKERIQEENVLLKKYGLKSKKEVWKTLAKVNYYRHRARELAKRPLDEQEVLFTKLKAIGLKVNNIADVLNLKIEDLLQRRLPTIVFERKFAPTVKTARQMVVHKRVMINGKIVNTPGYLVEVSEENSINVKAQQIKMNALQTENSENAESEETTDGEENE